MIETNTPSLEELMTGMGEVGARLAEIEATEGAAGNITVYAGWKVEPCKHFPIVETIALPQVVPALAGHAFLVTGSGRRLREIMSDPTANLGCVVVDPGGETGQLFTSKRRKFARLTSEFNSHLAVHADQVALTGTNFQVVVHAQSPYLTYLSHIPRYQDTAYFNRHVLRWEPELIIQMPEGIGVIPFCVPGSQEMMERNLAGLRKHQVVLWSKHGVMARCGQSIKHVCDLIEYAEAGARYEYLNLCNGEQGQGLSVEEIRAVCAAFGVRQEIF